MSPTVSALATQRLTAFLLHSLLCHCMCMFTFAAFRRNLVVCPVLEGEEKLRLLNLQHNFIRHIENIGHLKRLVFLDLYANCIEGICGLKELVSLRVLMLGKNRIQRVTGLETLSKLDVLDLHGNQVCVCVCACVCVLCVCVSLCPKNV